jgi:hypothetical protein
LWSYEPESFIAQFVDNYPLAVAGISGSPAAAGGQLIFQFRTADAGRMSLQFMESIVQPSNSLQYSGLTSAQKAIVDFVISADNWILGRDTSYPKVFHQMHPGQNEALWKNLFRA